jgi:plasmid stabilization system protein ParE
MSIRFFGRSAAHAQTIDAWWRKNRPSAPDLFTHELTGALRLLTEAPDIGVPYLPKTAFGVRRLLLSRTQYHIYYAHDRERAVPPVLQRLRHTERVSSLHS